MSSNKTHWLQNPNKNYLGHWDLPNGKDLVLTIKSAAWEEVENPRKKQRNNSGFGSYCSRDASNVKFDRFN